MSLFLRAACAGLVACSFVSLAWAGLVTPSTEYRERIKISETVQPLGETPFGENVNLYKGGLSFQQTDITYPGQGPNIVFSRSYELGGGTASAAGAHEMADWVLSIPRIKTIVPGNRAGSVGTWRVASSNGTGDARCSQFGAMSAAPYGSAATSAWFGKPWWSGYQLITPDGRSQPLLRRTPENTLAPSTGTYNIVTASHWMISCLPTTANGQPGEAFLALAPDGTRYWFNYLVYGPPISMLEFEIGEDGRAYLPRKLAYMYVTRIEDRFGNWVTYAYTNGRPTSVTASDGRQAQIQWRTDLPVIDSITLQPGTGTARTWRYEYTAVPNWPAGSVTLSRVVQPDQSAWSFAMGLMDRYDMSFSGEDLSLCGLRAGGGATVVGTTTLTHPSGLVGSFDIARVILARAAVPTVCQDIYEQVPAVYEALSLRDKTLSGPGLAARTWHYDYSPAVGSSSSECTAQGSACQDASWVEVTEPGGAITRYTHSTRWGVTEGQLRSVIRGLSSPGQATPAGLSQQTLTYAAPNAGPWPALMGDNLDAFSGLNNNAPIEQLAPTTQTVTVQQGVNFTWQVANDCGSSGTAWCFDQFARPTKVIKSSAPAP